MSVGLRPIAITSFAVFSEVTHSASLIIILLSYSDVKKKTNASDFLKYVFFCRACTESLVFDDGRSVGNRFFPSSGR